MASDRASFDYEELRRRVETLESRVEALESLEPALDDAGEDWDLAESGAAPRRPAAPARAHPVGALPLIGGTLLILAGAFFLRSLTESGTLSLALGAVLGIAYALGWFSFSSRAAARGQMRVAHAHALAATAIFYPLIWESLTRFGVLTPRLGAVVLAAGTALALFIAWRHRMRAVALMVTLIAGGMAIALGFRLAAPVPYTVTILSLGFVSSQLGAQRAWASISILWGILADFFVLSLGFLYLVDANATVVAGLQPSTLLVLQLSLVFLYLGNVAWRTLLRHHPIRIVDMVQAFLALAIGLGGATIVAHRSNTFEQALPIATLAVGLACYAAAFAVIDRSLGRRQDFHFYATSALIITTAGLLDLLRGEIRAGAFVLVALLTAALARRYSRATLSLHMAAYGIIATAPALMTTVYGSLVSAAPDLSAWTSFSRIGVLLGLVLCASLPLGRGGAATKGWAPLPRRALLGVVVLSVTALVAAAIAGALTRLGVLEAGGVRTHVVGTAALAGAAVLVAWLRSNGRFVEGAWITIPLLIIGGLKLLAVDLRTGDSAVLFLSLAFYGGSLILGSRYRRRGANARPVVGLPASEG